VITALTENWCVAFDGRTDYPI